MRRFAMVRPDLRKNSILAKWIMMHWQKVGHCP